MPDPLTAGMPERLENRMGRRVEKPQSKKNAITNGGCMKITRNEHPF
jgi:hypothetical protein